MNKALTIKILREIAEPNSGHLFSRREAARSAINLIEQQDGGVMTECAPKRAVQFRIEIGADNMEALATTLMNLSLLADRSQLSSHSVSGGYDSGYEHWLTVSDGPTHDEYVRQLYDWMEVRK